MKYEEDVLSIARAAGAAILAIYESDDRALRLKDDRTPLTAADLAAHELIVERLTKLDASIPVLSEESPAVPLATRASWRRFWLVDPLDGTREFISRNGEFTVNIALIESGAPVFGVIFAPVLESLFWTRTGQGAFARIADRAPARIAVSDYRTQGLRVAASRSHAGEHVGRFLRALGDPPAVGVGSSLKFCQVAEGSVTLYPRFGPTMEWDVAAGCAIVAAAGGTVTDIDGAPLLFNKADLHNPWFVVTGAPAYPWREAFDASGARVESGA